MDPLKRRLRAPDAGRNFPSSIPEDSPFRVEDPEGWQFFDRGEFDAIMQALEKARRHTEGAPGNGLLHEGYGAQWGEIQRSRQNGGYDLVLFWWLV